LGADQRRPAWYIRECTPRTRMSRTGASRRVR
jgi:hypothetical protein